MNRDQILAQMKPRTIVQAQNCVMVEEIKGESNSASKSGSKSISSDSDIIMKKKLSCLEIEEPQDIFKMESDESIQLRIIEKIPMKSK